MKPGTCKHYLGIQHTCLAGVDVRAHVGGPLIGWALRIPCRTEPRGADKVPCAKYAEPSAEDLATAEAALKRQRESAVAGRSPRDTAREDAIRRAYARKLVVDASRVTFDEELRPDPDMKPGAWCCDGVPIAESVGVEVQREVDAAEREGPEERDDGGWLGW